MSHVFETGTYPNLVYNADKKLVYNADKEGNHFKGDRIGFW
jgi:hypothetical protein